MAKLNKVLYNIDQTGDTTDAEKKTARKNIGCPEIVTSTTSLPPVETAVSKLMIKKDGRVYTDNTVAGNILPTPKQEDIGKVATATWSGSPGIGGYQLTTINQIPASTVSNYGQALIVDSSGNPVWSKFNALPDIGNNDNGKVLTVNDTGIPVWGTGFIAPAFGQNKAFTRSNTTDDKYEYSYNITMPTGYGWSDIDYAGMMYTIFVNGGAFDTTETWDVKINGSNWTTGIRGNFSTYTCNIPAAGITFTVTTSHNVTSVRMSFIILPQITGV